MYVVISKREHVALPSWETIKGIGVTARSIVKGEWSFYIRTGDVIICRCFAFEILFKGPRQRRSIRLSKIKTEKVALGHVNCLGHNLVQELSARLYVTHGYIKV